MKNIITSFFISVFSVVAFGQVEDFGEPKAWSGKLNMVKDFEKMPYVDKEEQIEIDSINRANGFEKTIRFGYEHHVEIDVLNEGVRTVTPKGHVYTLYGIECEDALSINVIFDKFNLSENARIYLLDEYEREYIGAHTAKNNNEANVLGTEIIRSDRVLIEVFEPKDEIGQSELVLGTVVHGYKDLDVLMYDYMKNLNGSGDCNIDVNCPEGDGWEEEIKSVARIVAGGGFCTGSLVNNTSGDIIPYFLSAEHCGTNVSGWVYRFRWEAPENGTSCATTGNSSQGPTNMTINGSTLRASNSNADFLLVELNNEPDPQWDIYYNGWDNTDATNITQTTGIHHPAGDIKKICHSDMAPTKQTGWGGNPNAEFWYIPSWTEGVTEGGSSGSPLFNQSGKVVGVLTAGAAACNGTVNNGQYDIYGRFGVAWDDLPNPSDQLKHWLDPEDTGLEVIDGVNPLKPPYENNVTVINVEKVSDVICGRTVYPRLVFQNNGAEDLTSFEIEFGYNGNTFTESWSGNLATNQTETLDLTPFSVSGGEYNFELELTLPNGETDENPADNSFSSTFLSEEDGEYIGMDLLPDCYGEEIEWEIKDENDIVWYSGGPYVNSSNPQVEEYLFCLAPGCYELTIYDEWGDGMYGSQYQGCGIDGEMQLYRNNTGEILAEIDDSNVDYGDEITFEFCAENTLGVNQEMLENISVYPNPTTQNVTINFGDVEGEKVVYLRDVTGKNISSFTVNGVDDYLFDMSSFAKGAYTLHINYQGSQIVKKIIKN